MLQQLSSKLEFVYPPVEFPAPNRDDAMEWKRSLGLSDHRLIGFAGRWVEEKGFDYLLRAFPLIKAEIPTAHLVFAGEKKVAYEDTFAGNLSLIQAIQEDITFLGLIDDHQKMANFYAMCDVFVLPSRTDMMALVQIESMLSGTPVVASDIPGARVVVQETGFGQLSPPHDPIGLAEIIVNTLHNAERYRPTIEGVRRVFDTEQTFERYENILASVIPPRLSPVLPPRPSSIQSAEMEKDGGGE
jgi:glycosyltransferase involved in cell wall biosynthesis